MLWPRNPIPPAAKLVAVAFASALCLGAAAASAPHVHVSQKNQAFNPNELAIARGTTLDVVNDDGDTLHHAYVDSSTFTFDSGDQEPGTTIGITFTREGTFTVLCGIHPRMKLKVRVE